MNIPKLLFEMFFLGVSFALLGLLVSYIFDVMQGKKIDWWPKHVYGMLVGSATTAALFHFIFEIAGLNEWYVKQYKPLLK